MALVLFESDVSMDTPESLNETGLFSLLAAASRTGAKIDAESAVACG